jgi:hypothetical protein
MSDATQIVELLSSLDNYMMHEPVGDENSDEWFNIRIDIGTFRDSLTRDGMQTARDRERTIKKIERIRDTNIRNTVSFNPSKTKLMEDAAFNRHKQRVRDDLNKIIKKITEMGQADPAIGSPEETVGDFKEITDLGQADPAIGPPEETVGGLNTTDIMWSNTQLFVLAYLRQIVAAWVMCDWETKTWDEADDHRRKTIMHELERNEELTMEIFEASMLKCTKPFSIELCHRAIVHHLEDINNFLRVGAGTTSEAWGLIQTNIAWYEYRDAKNPSDTVTRTVLIHSNLSVCYPNTVDGLLRDLNAFV